MDQQKSPLIPIVLTALITFSLTSLFWFWSTTDTDLTPPTDLLPKNKCGIETCHGLDITCGPNIPEACTEIFTTGDVCRPFASCEVIDGTCQQKPDPRFESCKTCVERCEKQYENASIDEQGDVFLCAEKCASDY